MIVSITIDNIAEPLYYLWHHITTLFDCMGCLILEERSLVVTYRKLLPALPVTKPEVVMLRVPHLSDQMITFPFLLVFVIFVACEFPVGWGIRVNTRTLTKIKMSTQISVRCYVQSGSISCIGCGCRHCPGRNGLKIRLYPHIMTHLHQY